MGGFPIDKFTFFEEDADVISVSHVNAFDRVLLFGEYGGIVPLDV